MTLDRGAVVNNYGASGNDLSRGLSLDLEVGKRDQRIHYFAGVRFPTTSL